MISISSSVFQFPIVPPDIQYKYSFKTDFEPTIRGSEARVIRWGEYRLSLSFPEMPLREDELATLKDFHSARGGKREGFLVKVPDNHLLTTEQGRLLPLDATNQLFQIVRVHSLGSAKTYKPIRYPVSGTTRVFIDGVESLDGWAVNTSTGQVQFTAAETRDITASCEFYTPMRFDNDTIEGLQVSGGDDDLFRYIENPSYALQLLREQVGSIDPIYQVSGLTLKEVHLPISKSFYTPPDFLSITTDFSYPIAPQNVRTHQYTVELEESPSGVENTVARDVRTITRYLSTGVENDELDYLLNYFLVAKGRGVAFTGKRFDTDEFSYTRTSPDFSIVSELPTISSADGETRQYQIFGRFLSKHTNTCNTIQYWRTVNPVIISAAENVADVRVLNNGARWYILTPSGQQIELWELSTNPAFSGGNIDNYELKRTLPENVSGGFFGIFISYRDKSLLCTNDGAPSFPRGDEFVITDLVEVTDHAIGAALPYATILKITRRDGVIKAYTSWDSDLSIDGITYKSNAGIIPTAISSKSDMSADSLEVSTFLDDVTEVDIISGKYEGALIDASVINVTNLAKEPILIFGGEVGEISSGDTRFTFELRSKSFRLNQSISVKTGDQCENDFCDSGCKLDIADYTVTGFTVTEIKNSKYSQRGFLVEPAPAPGDFANGYVEFTSGQLNGVKLDIKEVIYGGEVKLWSNLPYGLAIGDELNLVRGCAKTPDACKSYNNYINFGGFPVGGNWMVGNDALLAGD